MGRRGALTNDGNDRRCSVVSSVDRNRISSWMKFNPNGVSPNQRPLACTGCSSRYPNQVEPLSGEGPVRIILSISRWLAPSLFYPVHNYASRDTDTGVASERVSVPAAPARCRVACGWSSLRASSRTARRRLRLQRVRWRCACRSSVCAPARRHAGIPEKTNLCQPFFACIQ
jgi:hypothetical protein